MLTKKLLSLFVAYAIVMIPACGTQKATSYHTSLSESESSTLDHVAMVKTKLMTALPAQAAKVYESSAVSISKKIETDEVYFIDKTGNKAEPYQYNLKPQSHYLVDKKSGYATRVLFDQAAAMEQKFNVTYIVANVKELSNPRINKQFSIDTTQDGKVQREHIDRMAASFKAELQKLEAAGPQLGFLEKVEGFLFPTAFAESAEEKLSSSVRICLQVATISVLALAITTAFHIFIRSVRFLSRPLVILCIAGLVGSLIFMGSLIRHSQVNGDDSRLPSFKQ